MRTHFVIPKTHSMDPEAVVGALTAVYGEPAHKTSLSYKFVLKEGMELLVRPYKTGKTIIDVAGIPSWTEYKAFVDMFSAWHRFSKEPDNATTPPKPKKLRKRHRHLRGNRAMRHRSPA